MTGTYFTLVSSLPALPHFEVATRVPINRERLERRLDMLNARDRQEVRLAEGFLTWQRQPEHRSDEEVLEAYGDVIARARSRPLIDMVTERLRKRVIQAAARRRFRGGPPPEPDEPMGRHPLAYTLRRYWSRPDLGLGASERWVTEMVDLLNRGDTTGVERLLIGRSWNMLSARMTRARPRFDFEAVLVYLFQWDIVNRWVAYDSSRARERFVGLLEEAWHGFEWPAARA